MVAPFLKGLAEERVVLLNAAQTSQLPFSLKGIVRLVDLKGQTLGVLFDKDMLDELEEEIEAANPAWLASLEASRRSGRVSGKEVRKKAGLK